MRLAMKAKMAEEKEKLRAEKRHHQVSVLFSLCFCIYMAIIREQQTEVPRARNATDSHACAYLPKANDEKHFLRGTAPNKVTNSCYRLRWKVWGRKLIEVASDGKQQHNESLFQSIPSKTAVFEVAFFSVSFCLSNCQLCFYFHPISGRGFRYYSNTCEKV